MFSVVFTKTAVTQLFVIQPTNCTKGYLMHLLVMHDKSLTRGTGIWIACCPEKTFCYVIVTVSFFEEQDMAVFYLL